MPLTRTEEALVQSVCTQVHEVSLALGLPEDDLQQAMAMAYLLTERGLPARWEMHAMVMQQSRLKGLEMANVMLDAQDTFLSIQGKQGDWDALGQARLRELRDHHGIKVDPADLDYVATHHTNEEILASRDKGFIVRVAHLVKASTARLANPDLPLPTRLENLPPDGGPVTRVRYATKLHGLVKTRNLVGLDDLLDHWEQDHDNAKPHNLPLLAILTLMDIRDPSVNEVVEVQRVFEHALRLGADPTQSDDRNLVSRLVIAGHLDICERLLDQGCASHQRDGSSEQGPLEVAIKNGHHAWALRQLAAGRFTVNPGTYHHGLASAVSRGLQPVVEELLSAGANPTLADGAGDTLLHLLVRSEPKVWSKGARRAMAKCLLDRGVPLHACNQWGLTAGRLAQEKNDKALADYLLSGYEAEHLAATTPSTVPGNAPRRTL